MSVSLRESVLATVCYADIFDYPLTEEDLRFWLIRSDAAPVKIPGNVAKTRSGALVYLHLPHRQSTLRKRKDREKWALWKWSRVKKIVPWFCLIPTIRLIGVTGALAMNNTFKEDDIDIFIIADTGTLWISRLLVVFLGELFGIRRRPGDGRVKDKFCFNMFMTADSLAIGPNDRDLYMAHEVLQMIPLWQTDDTYRNFLNSNSWTKHFLPQAWNMKSGNSRRIISVGSVSYLRKFFVRLAGYFEQPARVVQLHYMQRRRSSEILTGTVLRFHPRDARIWIKRELRSRLKSFGIPLDKIFYA